MSAKRSVVAARRAARLVAVQSLYEMELSGKKADQVLNEVARRRDGLPGASGIPSAEGEADDALATPPAETDMTFCAELVRGVSANAEAIDGVIGRAMSDGRTPDKMETVLRTILRAGSYEIGQRRDIDPPVTISEFVGLAERFFADREPALVNGLLDRIARDLRPEDMAETTGHDGQG